MMSRPEAEYTRGLRRCERCGFQVGEHPPAACDENRVRDPSAATRHASPLPTGIVEPPVEDRAVKARREALREALREAWQACTAVSAERGTSPAPNLSIEEQNRRFLVAQGADECAGRIAALMVGP